MFDKVIRDYYNAIYDTNYQLALDVIYDAKKSGVTPEEIVFNIVLPSIDKMLDAFLITQESSISQHFLASKISDQIVEEMLPLFSKKTERHGNIILGTSFGDFHGLGRKIVSGCLKANLYNVIDLGLNVVPERFVDEALKNNAKVIGISSMMLHSATGENGSIKVREILTEKKLTSEIKIVVGGAPYKFDKDLYKTVGADAWAYDALSGIKIIGEFMGV
ncbi:MAG TPA: cobalamin-dependent protein [Spirochaetota bacterium]|nr:cobalamin-dependent protein [Spirochaetota bacterium]